MQRWNFRLEALLRAGNTRAVGYAPWVERCLCPEAPATGWALLEQMESLDFPAALKTVKALRHCIPPFGRDPVRGEDDSQDALFS